MSELIDVPRHRIVPLVLRRMRAPLLTLIVAYAVSVLGLVLIEGTTAAGEPYRVDFLHAFYFVSYTATTIGFGELPTGFNQAQRLWVVVSLHLLVISWFYAIGTIVGIIRDPVFQRVVTWNRFRRSVSRLVEPFTLVCGYGDTGSQLVREITGGGGRAVVIDWDERQLDGVSVEGLRSFVPHLCGDANFTDNLLAAGLGDPRCRAVLAVTDDDHTNLHIAITTKLLNPRLPVIARAEHDETRANMASFGTDYIIDPYLTFAGGFVMAMEAPQAHRLYSWMSVHADTADEERLPPAGRWIVCGYTALGRALYRRLREHGMDLVLVTPDTVPASVMKETTVIAGKGTEAVTLREAGIEAADVAGVIAATDDDTDNLSIVMTARELRGELYLVARQNDRASHAVFEAAAVDRIMESSSIMAVRMLRLLATPMLPRFLQAVRERDDEWIGTLLERWHARVGEASPEVWTLTVGPAEAPALFTALGEGAAFTVAELLRDPRERDLALAAEVLMIERGDTSWLLPGPDRTLARGDRVLLCARHGERARMQRTVTNRDVFRYVASGEQRPDGWLWRRLAARRER
ncbi:Glutathione-regulated potassium-efflux system protein KefC [wastewater metagenome]|uniref:Glutathione-regulated potassium-efflux system protein KefC n=3 Tax=root TaxID=1 RepID=A0A5B8RFS1_9ZZZZ|nr:glutathione-regulated potassium-efflux system protein KefC [uncultured organism]